MLSRLTTTSKRVAADPLGQAARAVAEVVDAAEVGAELEAGVLERGDLRAVLLARREHRHVGGAAGLGHDAGEGHGCFAGHVGVPSLTVTGTSGVHGLSGDPLGVTGAGSSRRSSSPVRIFSCSVRMACISVSGLGGQPGA